MIRSRTLGLALAATVLVGATTAAAEEIDDLVELCTTCHGEDGRPIEPDYPIIWGQEFYYLYVQLKDYQAGRRENEIMQGIVADLTKEQMQALSQHFSEREWPRIGFGASEVDIAQGEIATGAGQCTQCHLGGYDGDSRIPRLAGQNPAYLERTMLEFKNRVRMNAPDKGALLRAYEDDDIRAMANLLAGL